MSSPVYTIENECQDCYKCVRHCPVKAIRIVNAKASVIEDACVACGECVKVCPAHAKKIRDDLHRLEELLASGVKLYASIAPSFVGYYRGVGIETIAEALRRCGFAAVSETAHGAEAVSAKVLDILKGWRSPIMISSACPACVDYIRKYMPGYAKFLSPVPSPLAVHSEMLHAASGGDAKVVFFGPCAAKKNESDRSSGRIDIALTFRDLDVLLARNGIDLKTVAACASPENALLFGGAEEGRFYSIEGGMNDTLRGGGEGVRYVSLSGIESLKRLLEGFDPVELPEDIFYGADGMPSNVIFVECLACPGGCVNGPAMCAGGGGLATLFATDAKSKLKMSTRRVENEVACAGYETNPVVEKEPSEEDIVEALHRVGKFSPCDELNCGACGYDSCRDFAKALLARKAEEAMCHNYLRKNFERTSNALIKYIPAAVVIVDSNLLVTEANARFAELAGVAEIFEAIGGVSGMHIAKTLPQLEPLFRTVLGGETDITRYRQHYGERIVNVSVFPIAKGKFAGAVLQDVTGNEFKRERVSERAREVIRKNVITVQEVARLFGEHIAETEIMLNEIAGTYESSGDPVKLRNSVMRSDGIND
jgi:iron only hydrogenase large subunit-like protein